MDTSRDDVGIAFRSAFLARGTKQKFSLFVLVILSILFIFIESLETKPLNYLRSFIKDIIYRGSSMVSMPTKSFGSFTDSLNEHISLYNNYTELKKENTELRNKISKSDFLELKNGMEVLDGKNFIGRTVDVNFFSSRVLLVSDLNSRIPVITEPSAYHAILNGRGIRQPILVYLPEKHTIQNGDKVYTSGKAGIFTPGIPIGEIKIEKEMIKVILFSDLNQITFVNINLGKSK